MTNLGESVSDSPVRDIVLRDGSTLALRPGRASDVDSLLRFFGELTPQSRYQRFFGFPDLDVGRARILLAPDKPGGMALIGEVGGKMVAFAGFYRTSDAADCAEVAFAIADALQGRGIGTRMLEQLGELARRQGIRTFDASVLADNRRMMDMFLDSGYSVTSRLESGVVYVTLELEPTASFVEKVAERAQHAATASMKAFFQPQRVAVIGANRTRGQIGCRDPPQPDRAGFTGAIVRCTHRHRKIAGSACLPRVLDIPGPVDLAVIVVPAAQVLAVGRRLHRQGREARICVISAGFGESGAEGAARSRTAREDPRGAGCRLDRSQLHGALQYRSGRAV